MVNKISPDREERNIMKQRFKDIALDEMYKSLFGSTPIELSRCGVWGMLLSAFTIGYNGLPLPKYIVRNSRAYAAYVAGKETPKSA